MIRRIGLLSVLAGAAIAANISPASGSVTIGQTGVPNTGCVDGDWASQQMGARAAVGDAVEDIGDACIHQQIGCIACMVGQALDGHQVP